MIDETRSKAERCPTCDLPSTWRNRTCDDPFHENPQGRTFWIEVCDCFRSPWDRGSEGDTCGTCNAEIRRIEVVPASPPKKGEE